MTSGDSGTPGMSGPVVNGVAPSDDVGPGEVRPRGLDRPPSSRYERPAPAVREHPDQLRSLLIGLTAGAATAVAWALLSAVLDVRPGLIVVALAGGWAIGSGVRWGAWGGAPHAPSSRGPLVAGLLGAGTWLAGLLLSWVAAQALIQGSTRTLSERLAATPFLDWLLPQVGVLEPLALLLLVGTAAYTARER